MTAQFLQNELTNLLQEAKRKSPELRAATEKSLAELKPLVYRTESEVVAELSQNSTFVTPFISACASKNAKLSATAVSCLQRLAVSGGLAKTRLKEVLESFREATNLGLDIQLKILQALPPLLQNYAASLQGELLGEALLICSILQSNKSPIINNTAAATLQQLVISVFDKVVGEDDKAANYPYCGEISINKEKVQVRPAALDAYRVFNDLCLLTEGQKSQFVRFTQLSQTFGLELIESVLTNHSDIFLSHPEQAHILRSRVVPLVIRSLSDRLNFATTVRIIRVLYILLRRHLSILERECEVALGLLTHMLDPDAAALWKRALCMEIIKGIFAEPTLVRKIYTAYDAKEGSKSVIKDLSAALARLSTEKPSIIGLGTQSSVPSGNAQSKDTSSEQAALEAGGVAGIIGGAVGLGDVTVSGLSMQWSLMRVPCIDHLDKTEPPSIPDSYIYCLALNCINSFSEGLAKFILPLVSSSEGSKGSKKKKKSAPGKKVEKLDEGEMTSGADTPKRSMSPALGTSKNKPAAMLKNVLPNPLNLENHPLKGEIDVTAAIVDNCWPALLACYSTFLYSTLDSELYHALVRSFQKFTQAAGVLRLATPRDAFLTTLGKAAVPSNFLSGSGGGSAGHHTGSETSTNQGLFANAKGLLSVDSFVSTSTIMSDRSSGYTSGSAPEPAVPALNTRNLLCLRALLNLGTVLGPSLEDSWTIVLETLQNADYILYSSMRKNARGGSGARIMEPPRSSGDPQAQLSNIGSELTAVENAATRMFESTKEFSDEAFVSLLLALCKLLGFELLSHQSAAEERGTSPSRSPQSPTSKHHRRLNSISISTQMIGDNAFVLAKLGELALANVSRIVGPDPSANGWDVIQKHLIMVSAHDNLSSMLRLKAADVLNNIIMAAAKLLASSPTMEGIAEVQERFLFALHQQILDNEYSSQMVSVDLSKKNIEREIHKSVLESLHTILEQSGDSLVAGWKIVFNIVRSAFQPHANVEIEGDGPGGNDDARVQQPVSLGKAPMLVKSAFNSLQLICSDFLSALPVECILILIDTLYEFCCQLGDLNISLTTITYFWNVSDFLQTRNADSGRDFELPRSEEDLMERVKRPSEVKDISMSLWIVLLLRLTFVGKDPRAEVRNGSIQTLFRIFDTYGHQLGPRAWNCCLHIVIFKIMRGDQVKEAVKSSEKQESQRKQWDETLNLVLTGIGTLYSNYFQVFSQQSDFEAVWNTLMVYLRSLLDWRSLDVNMTVFKELWRILDKIGDPQALPNECRDQVWELWASQGTNLVHGIDGGATRNGVQETMKAFVESFSPLYKLLSTDINASMIEKSLAVLRDCLLYPDAPAYFSDVDTLSPLQSTILSSIRDIRTDVPGASSLVIKEAAICSKMPYSAPERQKGVEGKSRLPTYVAVASTSIKMMEDTVRKHIEDEDIYESGAVETVFEALAEPINLKYSSSASNVSGPKIKPLWRQATQAALALLKPCLQVVDKLKTLEDERRGKIWHQAVRIITGVVSADTSNILDKALLNDEGYDIDAFRKLRNVLVPRLGRKVVPDESISYYVEKVFKASLLYKVADSYLDSKPMDAQTLLQPIHGSTSEPVLERRSKMAYVCIDELFALSELKDGAEAEWRRLAKSTSPYLIQRTALVLRHFVADQPLRGRMPQPRRLRKEILYILEKMVQLNAQPQSPATPSSHLSRTPKQHLFSLFPLISRAVAVAQGDRELLHWLSKALDEIGSAIAVQ